MRRPDDTLSDLLARAARARPDAPYCLFEGRTIAFAALDTMANGIATFLAETGLRPGARVAVMMQSSPTMLAVIVALARAGLVWVPLNTRQRGDGLRYILEHCAPRRIIADADYVETLEACLPRADWERFLVNGGGTRHACLPTSVGDTTTDAPRAEYAPDSPCAIMYTSGTTGKPKGVIVTHRMLRLSAEAAARVSGVTPGDRMFVWEPFSHIGGAQLLPLPLTHGVTLAIVPGFSASRFWDGVTAFGATHIHFLGGILQILLRQPPSPRDRDHGVRVAWGGGCPPEVWTAFEERFGVTLHECYGMTEASSITTHSDATSPRTVGKPVPWFSVRIEDAEGREVPVGARGEIVVSQTTPGALFPGYLDNPEATAQALRDGALHTGDLGSLDAEGNLRFHGRMTDSVRVRGENVSAWEVEHVAAQHPDVEDCAMIGVAAEIGEQDIKLFVQPRGGAALDAAALSDWLTARLASYQLPRYIETVAEFARTPSQRIMKHVLPTDLANAWDRLADQ